MYVYQAALVAVHDGDTLRMDIDLGFSVHFLTANPLKDFPQALRLEGYDAPELGRLDGFGERARDAVAAWFATNPGPYVLHSSKDRSDKYGRYLAAAIESANGRELINDQIVGGWLKPYSGRGPKPVWL